MYAASSTITKFTFPLPRFLSDIVSIPNNCTMDFSVSLYFKVVRSKLNEFLGRSKVFKTSLRSRNPSNNNGIASCIYDSNISAIQALFAVDKIE